MGTPTPDELAAEDDLPPESPKTEPIPDAPAEIEDPDAETEAGVEP